MVFRYNSYPRLIGINGLAGTVMDPTAGCNPGCVAAMAMAAMAGCVAIPSAGRGVGTEAAMAASQRVQPGSTSLLQLLENQKSRWNGWNGRIGSGESKKHQSHPSRITGIFASSSLRHIASRGQLWLALCQGLPCNAADAGRWRLLVAKVVANTTDWRDPNLTGKLPDLNPA